MKNNVFYILNFNGVDDSLFYNIENTRDELARPFIYLREGIESLGFKVKLVNSYSNLENAAALFSCAFLNPAILSMFLQLPKERRFFLLTEPPVVEPNHYDPGMKEVFGTLFTMFDDLVDNRAYFKFHHNQGREKIIAPIPDFDQKKLCVMIQTNVSKHSHPQENYSERQKTVLACDDSNDIDIYGAGWELFPNAHGRLTTDKLLTLKNYKFAFCYENMRNQVGYITERLFDAMFAGCVPIYWGADNIADYVPEECYIKRSEFATNEDMYRFIKQVDRKTYEEYQACARDYLSSSKYQEHFSPRCFSRDILKVLLDKNLLS
jgi:hypothetical protein